MSNCGNADQHCCWFQGKVCEFLEENTMPDRRWACGLMREHQDWNKVYADPRYIAVVAPKWEQIPQAGGACGDWPPKGVKCNDCGNCG